MASSELANSSCGQEDFMDLDDSVQEIETGGRKYSDIDSFIEEEFANIFDSEPEDGLYEDAPNAANSLNSSWILAQQLQILKDCNDSGGSSGVLTTDEGQQGNVTNERSLTAMKDGAGLSPEKNYCEKCKRLQANNSNSIDSGIGETQKDNSIETGAHQDARKHVVRDDQIIDILEELGTCWRTLGPILGIKTAKIQNMEADYAQATDKASCLLTTWKEQEGRHASVEVLEQALVRIKRKDIADKFMGIVGLSSSIVQPIQHIDKPLNLNIRVGLNTDLAEPDTSVLLCEDSAGRKYLVKEVTDDKLDWNIEKIVDDERALERMIIAARNSRRTREERRQESLRRVSAELTQLRKRMHKGRLDKDSDEEDITDTSDVSKSTPIGQNHSKMPADEMRELLTTCQFQSESSQRMYKVLIKLIGEVGPLEGNSRCLKQLADFTKELREEETKLIPKLGRLSSSKEDLDEKQITILESLVKWQETQNKQVDGIEKLLTSLLEQGSIKWNRKQANRRSEPIFNKLGGNRSGRRRAKTDSSESKSNYLSGLQDARDEQKKKQISLPVCARQMQKM